MEHLCASEGFREHGDLAWAMRTDKPTVLANTDSVGGHICTWVRTSAAWNTVQKKVYHKVVLNFEACEIGKPIGGHLADTADCLNDHLLCTFLHPDVQARGCTRIEVTLYACRGGDLSANTAKEAMEEAFALVSPSDLPGLFVVQPPTKQWENLASCLDRCLVLADRPRGSIFDNRPGLGSLGPANQGTRRQRGNMGECHRTDLHNCIQTAQTAADFGFGACPIFRVNILGANEEGVELGLLRCYSKEADAGTILAASKRPTQLHSNGPEPSCRPLPWFRWFGGPTRARRLAERSRPSVSKRCPK